MSLAGSAGFYFLGASVCIGAIITSRSLSSCLCWFFLFVGEFFLGGGVIILIVVLLIIME